MRTSARAVALLLFDEVELLDVAAPLEVLSVAGRHWNWRPFKVTTVARQAGLLATRNQLRIEATHALEDCPVPEIVIVPGGYGARRALSEESILTWLRAACRSAALVASVGYGALLLGKAGMLDGRRIAVPSDVLELFKEVAPTAMPLADQELELDPSLISAAQSGAALEVGLHIVEQTLGKKQAKMVRTKLGYEHQTADSIEIVGHEKPSRRG